MLYRRSPARKQHGQLCSGRRQWFVFEFLQECACRFIVLAAWNHSPGVTLLKSVDWTVEQPLRVLREGAQVGVVLQAGEEGFGRQRGGRVCSFATGNQNHRQKGKPLGFVIVFCLQDFTHALNQAGCKCRHRAPWSLPMKVDVMVLAEHGADFGLQLAGRKFA